MTETQFSTALQAYVRRCGGVAIKFHGNGLTQSGVPDIWGTHRGRPFAVELKAPNGTPSPLQRAMLKRLAAGGYVTGIVKTLDDFERLFNDTA